MAPNENAPITEEPREASPARRKASRYVVPVAVAGVAAATIGLVPALAASGDPDLPKITAQELIEKIAASDAEQLDGTVKITTDLGIPDLGGLADSLVPKDDKSGASASPEAKLMELASGTHTVRVAADGPDKQKLSFESGGDEYSVVHNGNDVWMYDSASNEVVHSKEAGAGEKAPQEELPTTPKQLADEALKAVDDTTSVTVDGTARIAGRDAYQLLIKPKQSGSTIGSIKVAVDAENGVPLKFTLLPSDGGKAAIDAGFTKVDFAKPAASTFDFKVPKGAKVTEADELNSHEKGAPKAPKSPEELEGLEGMEDFNGLNVIGEGWTAIAELKGPEGEGATAPEPGEGDVPPEAQKFLDSLGDQVKGDFGTGTVFKTRLVNALMTDDGKVYVGAVTQDALVKAANAAN
ncbi:outer-membrane lipoprotein carrier protein LolA [Streptomyces sp. NPDC000410]|uniref:LolA family protein n=1 Tax=Streptomyces sp. NPDC000410 TaxID=3154254 RepID=UPI00331FA45E